VNRLISPFAPVNFIVLIVRSAGLQPEAWHGCRVLMPSCPVCAP